MDVFSLEDDSESNMFLTQESSNNSDSGRNTGILGDPYDFTSPCASLLSCKQDQYSDISDDDFFQFPSSQQVNTDTGGKEM